MCGGSLQAEPLYFASLHHRHHHPLLTHTGRAPWNTRPILERRPPSNQPNPDSVASGASHSSKMPVPRLVAHSYPLPTTTTRLLKVQLLIKKGHPLSSESFTPTARLSCLPGPGGSPSSMPTPPLDRQSPYSNYQVLSCQR